MKDLIASILDFLKKSSIGKILLVAGLGFIVLGIVGTKIGVEDTWRFISFGFGAVLLALTMVQYTIISFRGKLVKSFVESTKALIEEQTKQIVAEACGQLQNHNVKLLEAATTVLVAQTKELKEAERHLVAHVEDSTRRVLNGIPEIFNRAYRMIKRADREIWLINFVLEFGKVHCVNPTVVEAYKSQFDRDFSEDVAEFYKKLKMKVQDIPEVNLLTISREGALTNFLLPLLQREEYRTTNAQVVLENMENAKHLFKTTIAEARKGSRVRRYRYCELASLPIQILICGLRPEDGESEKRYGCLVFMVGSETLAGMETGQESGFYTELEPMVLVMKNLASALMRAANVLYEETDNQNVSNFRRLG